ncbi:MAG: hypothetical protein CR974_04300 [Gammaproteobacteria bacterium]|nr:MAG: hypothetical protein CR974_04300 [Gammaproteobacteria bacterium]
MDLSFIPGQAFLPLAVTFSVIVSIILKIARRSHIVLEQAITFNYLMALTLTLLWFYPTSGHLVCVADTCVNVPWFTQIVPDNWKSLPWAIYVPLGILLPSVFIFMGKAVQHAGIIRADIAQRLSLIIPLVAAVVIFKEHPALHKMVGVGVAFLALFCLLARTEPKPTPEQLAQARAQGQQPQNNHLFAVFFLLCTFVGYGVIDVLFKQLSKSEFIPGLTYAFAFGFVFMVLFVFLCYQTWTLRSIVGGLILGVFNFLNIICYIKAHQYYSTSPTVVFVGMNIGVIALGTIIGALIFREKMRVINILGVILAGCAVYLMYYGKDIVAHYWPIVTDFFTSLGA